MKEILRDEKFIQLSQQDKDFILSFDKEMNLRGYECALPIGSGYCWGKYMFIYNNKAGKTKKNPARIYIRNNFAIAIRLYLTSVGKHRAYIESLSPKLKMLFTDNKFDCRRCKTQRADSTCVFRKTYTIDNVEYRKCHGGFLIENPKIEDLHGYLGLIFEFYKVKM